MTTNADVLALELTPDQITSIDDAILQLICGGTVMNYKNAIIRGAIEGTLEGFGTGLIAGSSSLMFTGPVGAGITLGACTVGGGLVGAIKGAYGLYSLRNPMEPTGPANAAIAKAEAAAAGAGK